MPFDLERSAKNIVNKYADLMMPKKESWDELEAMIIQFGRRVEAETLARAWSVCEQRAMDWRWENVEKAKTDYRRKRTYDYATEADACAKALLAIIPPSVSKEPEGGKANER